MKEEITILIAEDEAGHFELVRKNLWLSYIDSDIVHFKDGQEILDFLFQKGDGHKREGGRKYVLLLDIRMPKVDGREVLSRIKEDEELKKIPIIMLTTTDEVVEIDKCYDLGCSFYMVKPVDYHKFMRAVGSLGLFLSMNGMKVPAVGL